MFVLLNAAAVPAALAWRAAAVVAFVAVIWFAVLRGPLADQSPPGRAAMRTYGFAVLAMVVAIIVGARIISGLLDRPKAVLPWVVLVVGTHFLPFSTTFRLPIFRWLALSLIGVGVIGAVVTLVHDSATAAGWTGVGAGFVLLSFAGIGPRLSAR